MISPDVRIDEYSTVANSIVMSGARIGKHVRIVRAIVDKGAVIPDGSVLEAGNVAFDDDYDATESGIVVVPKTMAVSRIHGRRLRADGTAPTGDGPLGRILVVDDDKSIRMILAEVLEERGYLVYTAEDGPSALRVAEGKLLDLAFVDIVMAPMEGAEVIQELRRVNPGLRVVVVTSLTDEERAPYVNANQPLEFGHTLEDQLGGQMRAGFYLTGLIEDRWPDAVLDSYIPTFMATRAVKPQANG
mgnify:CR=1 FL=1